MIINLLRQRRQIPLIPLHLQPTPHPRPRLLPPAHLAKTPAPPPPRLPVPPPLELHARLRVRRALGPHPRHHVRLRAVREQDPCLVLHQGRGFPSGAAERHFDAVGVQLDGVLGLGRGRGGLGGAEGGVALVAHLLDLGGAFGVGGGRGRRGLVGEGEEGSVESVEGGEVGVEGGGGGGGEGFAGGVHLDGEEGEGFVHCGERFKLGRLEETPGRRGCCFSAEMCGIRQRVLSAALEGSSVNQVG